MGMWSVDVEKCMSGESRIIRWVIIVCTYSMHRRIGEIDSITYLYII